MWELQLLYANKSIENLYQVCLFSKCMETSNTIQSLLNFSKFTLENNSVNVTKVQRSPLSMA